MKPLKKWCGRGYCCINPNDPRWSSIPYNRSCRVNLAAYSRADAARLIREYIGWEGRGLDAELKNYFSPTWGNSMEGIPVERGIWIEFEQDKPVKVI